MAVKKPTKAKKTNLPDPTFTRKLSSGGFVTYADRVAVSKLLEANKYNIRQTARELNIEQALVKAWHTQVLNDDYAAVDEEKSIYATEVRRKTTEEMVVKTSAFLKVAFDVKEAALKQMKDLVPMSESIRDLAMVIKTLHEIENGSKMDESQEKELDSKDKGYMMKFVMQQLTIVNNTHQHGESSSKHTPAGDN